MERVNPTPPLTERQTGAQNTTRQNDRYFPSEWIWSWRLWTPWNPSEPFVTFCGVFEKAEKREENSTIWKTEQNMRNPIGEKNWGAFESQVGGTIDFWRETHENSGCKIQPWFCVWKDKSFGENSSAFSKHRPLSGMSKGPSKCTFGWLNIRSDPMGQWQIVWPGTTKWGGVPQNEDNTQLLCANIIISFCIFCPQNSFFQHLWISQIYILYKLANIFNTHNPYDSNQYQTVPSPGMGGK